jgi:hypothetical protein
MLIKFSFSSGIKVFKINSLSESKKKIINKQKFIIKKKIILLEKLNISLEARDVT